MTKVHISAEDIAVKALERIKAFPIGGNAKDTDKEERDDIVLTAREALRTIARLPSRSLSDEQPQTPATLESSREDLKARAIQILKRNGWQPGDLFSAHSTAELMVALALEAQRSPVSESSPAVAAN